MRMTRAAMRAQAHEGQIQADVQLNGLMIHSENDASTVSNSSDDSSRPALRDITGENYPTTESNIEAESEKPTTTQLKAKNKSRATKTKAAEVSADPTEPSEQAQGELNQIQDIKGVEDLEELPHAVGNDQSTQKAQDTQTPAKSTPVSLGSKTPKFDPQLHMPTEATAEQTNEDSFIETITSRSPTKLSQSQSTLSDQDKDPFVEDKSSLKSFRRASNRIEDSVEEMDALEDAIEQFTEDIEVISPKHTAVDDQPKMDHRASPRATTPAAKQNTSAARTPRSTIKDVPVGSPLVKSAIKAFEEKAKTPSTAPAKSNPSVVFTKVSPVKVSVKSVNPVRTKNISPTDTTKLTSSVRPSLQVRKTQTSTVRPVTKAVSRPSTTVKTMAPKASGSSTKATTTIATPAKQQVNVVKKRVTSSGILSTSKPGFIPNKSEKRPTTSTFVLPGEAVAAKLKAQREERLKRESDPEQDKPKQFKARPVPKAAPRPSLVPRENKASQARMRVISNGSDKENMAPRPSNARTTTSVNKTRAAVKPVDARANSSIRRTAPGVAASSVKPSERPSASTLSLSNGQKSVVTKEDSANQRVRGKEVFGRIRMSIEQQQKEKRDKEEAARKARAEAAERGRQASREWAEKQKKRMADSATAKTAFVTTAS